MRFYDLCTSDGSTARAHTGTIKSEELRLAETVEHPSPKRLANAMHSPEVPSKNHKLLIKQAVEERKDRRRPLPAARIHTVEN
jgi:hypothetical protein